MAKTGSVTITENSQNIAGNKSNITVKCIVKTTGSSYRGDHRTGTCTIDGVKYSFTHGAPANSTTTLFTKTLDVTHDSEGKKTVSASFTYDGGWATGSASKTLTTIKRAVTPTLSATSLSLSSGGKTTVTIGTSDTGLPSTYTYDIYYSFNGSSEVLIVSNTKLSYQWSADHNSLAKLIPNATSGTGYVRVVTKNGTTTIGSKSVNFSAQISSSSLKPTISSVTIKEAASIPSVFSGIYIKGKSKINVVISASGYNSTIISYSTTVNGSSYQGNNITSAIINTNGTINVDVTVTDSRGQKNTTTKTISVVDYSEPVISSFKAIRCDDDEKEDDDGEKVKFSYNVSVSPVNNKNTKSLVVQQFINGEWRNLESVSMSGYTLNSSFVASATFDKDTEHQFRLQLTDAFSKPSTSNASVSTSYTLINFHEDGHGISFGRAAQGDGFDVSLNSTFRKYNEFISGSFGQTFVTRDGSANGAAIGFKNSNGTLGYVGMTNTANGGLYRYSADTSNSYLLLDTGNYSNYVFPKTGGTINGSLTVTSGVTASGILRANSGIIIPNEGSTAEPNNRIMGTTTDGKYHQLLSISPSNNCVLGYGNYAVASGSTNIYGNDVNIFSKQANASYRPYYRKGDSVTVTIRTAGYVTSSKNQIHFIVPLQKPVLGSTTVTATTGTGFTFRQNDSYTHGTSSSTEKPPSSYACTLVNGGVLINATFSTTTNATNNDTIGIYWNGTINFT